MRLKHLLGYASVLAASLPVMAERANPVNVYRTLTKAEGQEQLSDRQKHVTDLIEAGGLARSVAMPIKRAKLAYEQDPHGCITMQLATINSFEIESAPLAWFPVWLFVRSDFSGAGFTDLDTVVTFGGGNYEQFAPHLRHVKWLFVQSYEDIVIKLKSGDVDGGMFGDAGVQFFVKGDPQLKPIQPDPVARIPSRVRCKATPETRDFIEDLNARLAARPN